MRSLQNMMDRATNFDTPEPVREKLVTELTQYPCKEVVTTLAKIAVVDISYAVRRSATLALCRINPDEAFDNFINNLKHKNPKIIDNSLHAIRQVGVVNPKRAIQAASQMLTHNHSRLRNTAAVTIQKLAGVKVNKARPQPKTRLKVVAPAHAFN